MEKLQAGHAASQYSLRLLAACAERAPDLVAAEEGFRKRVLAERRRGLLRGRLAELGTSPSGSMDATAVAAAGLRIVAMRFRLGSPNRAGAVAVEREVSRLGELERVAVVAGDNDTAKLGRQLMEEAREERSVWEPER